MTPSARQLLWLATLTCLCMFRFDAIAQGEKQAEPAQTAEQPDSSLEVETPASPTAQADDDASDADADNDSSDTEDFDRLEHRHGDLLLHFSNNAHLPANRAAKAVIAIFGSAIADGDVDESVVSIFGDMRLNGRADDNAAAIFGNAYINGKVRRDAVAVFGDVTLGPNAVVGGDVVAVGGSIIRDPGAVVHGSANEVYVGGLGHLEGLKIWVQQCLLYGRPLAFEPGLGWAWALAIGALALYIGLALLFPSGVERCVATLERQPGQWILASILTVLLTPVLMLLLVISLIGIGFIPFLAAALFCAALFGKAVVLAALGRRVTSFTGIGSFTHIAVAVLIGGIVVLGLYVVPVLGLIVQQMTGILGLGVVVYTFLLYLRSRRDSAASAPQPAPVQPAAASATIDAAAMNSGEANPNAGAAPTLDSGSATAAPSAIDATTLPRAGFLIRLGALSIDAVLIGVAVSIIEPGSNLYLIALAGYGAAMWKLRGTTIGGIVCNLRVVRLDGRAVNWDTSIVRALGCFVSMAFAGLGFLWIIFDEGRQSWHDKIAGTVVVRTKAGSLL
jgi:uncharacterized RDD family membrane protein YckC